MKKSLLYTRTGDAGMTSLVGGKRVAKNSPRVNAYGTLDELNAHIGLVQAHCAQLDNFVTATLLSINNTLFNLGAYLATPPAPAPADDSELPQSLRVIPDRIAELEQQIDTLDGSVPEQRTFILPGGSIGAAHAHVARTVCRRAEREILNLADTGEAVAPIVLTYINRLSDYLFILARYINHFTGTPDIPWQQS
ncbi:cob(I)yrinic acid a,c-diamide adenosyltransferase [Muribaculaceae bacterium Isolate-039 (Harlan)]|jgi:cob(I)alamin adenosyltransferase|uniref:Corrinoid adenosyltransferase n=2 Tax=Duncaniella muris TaxID=2094150 RepID=A0A2V1IJ17_9BACT|nr:MULTISPECIES: cob(I)yrinic acid a,c-diamide adenosyltransferase [Duncaniella]ROS90785.1 cob(I)yrinic acid a,c-diamide adenosyltransferase [Muribaculaceae bacterium Isolate-039 (Harlan)]ROS95685.1 cob(I)yrinic acid a,c-diamide adenosyltransferase [Muribaculaceae bacterium Isolate-083 (Janvier)]ROS98753.1 cob(I)yrinic acid a,c-diamide adenosyltransferase [Muribaculaceae bacterium Isolate-077 (Janvier)]ROT01679.1 cob(I)yrinic acid a,c-diamide adenosyltransferase [Muribaculaceae bacterium Isolat